MSYLRFTPEEFRSIWTVCRPLRLDNDFFLVFKYYLVEALLDLDPDLSKRVALFKRDKLLLLYNHLRAYKKSAAAVLKRRQTGPPIPE